MSEEKLNDAIDRLTCMAREKRLTAESAMLSATLKESALKDALVLDAMVRVVGGLLL